VKINFHFFDTLKILCPCQDIFLRAGIAPCPRVVGYSGFRALARTEIRAMAMNATKRHGAVPGVATTAPHSNGRSPADPGAVLKSLRKRNGWTLTAVSERTGVPVSTLSKLENGKMVLTFDKLLRISQGLDIDFSRLLGPAAGGVFDRGEFGGRGDSGSRDDFAGRRSVTRAGEGKFIEGRIGDYLYLASELLNKRMIPMLGEVRARSLEEFGEFHSHPGEEHLYVLEGELELHTEIYEPLRLKKGDSIYFDSRVGHAYLAVGTETCRVYSVCATSEVSLLHTLEGNAGAGGQAAAPRPAESRVPGSAGAPIPTARRLSRK
jgi:transcriptional regulator with XRE-family HTH domain